MKIIAIISIIGASCFYIFGQKSESVANAQFSVKTKSKNVCFGDAISIDTAIKNISQKVIVIDTKQIGSLNVFNRVGGNKTNDETAIGYGPSTHYEPNLITLNPSESYRKTITFTFKDDYFEKTAQYKMQVAYYPLLNTKTEVPYFLEKTVYSNNLLINVNKCRQE